MVELNELARKRGVFIANAAVASQNKSLIDDEVTTEAITLNIIAPLILEISERDGRIAELAAENERLKQRLADHPRATNTVDAHETANVGDKPEAQHDAETWVYDPSTELLQAYGRNPNVIVDHLFTRSSEQAVTEAHQTFAQMHRKFKLGDRVTKTKGSSWTGRVVGFYSTSLTPVGYAVESETETGSVQIYPEAALKAAMEAGRHE